MYRGLKIYQRGSDRIISFLRCGHRTLKELKDDNGLSFFKDLPIGPEFIKLYDLYSYTGKTYFIIRDPMEHMLSALTFTMGIRYDESLSSNGTFHLLDDTEKLQLTINELFEQKDNDHWVSKRYQFIYKSIVTNTNKDFKYEFILLKDLSDFLKREFNITETPNLEKFGHPNYSPAFVMKLLKLKRYNNIKELIDMCFIERYYYHLIKQNNIKINFLHDLIIN
jgi:hypothetical protein